MVDSGVLMTCRVKKVKTPDEATKGSVESRRKLAYRKVQARTRILTWKRLLRIWSFTSRGDSRCNASLSIKAGQMLQGTVYTAFHLVLYQLAYFIAACRLSRT